MRARSAGTAKRASARCKSAGARFFFQRAVPSQDHVKKVLDSQAAQHRNRKPVHFIAHHSLPFFAKILQRFMNIGIQHGSVEQVIFIATEKHAENFFEAIGLFFGKSLFEQVLHAAPDMSQHRGIRQVGQIEVSAGKVNRVREIPSGVRQGAV